MATDDGKIRYEDLISPDDSIKALIAQLSELNKTYSVTLELIKSGAKDIVTQLKSMNTTTTEGRTSIDEAAAAANRLARAQKELKFALSDTGKEVAYLKSQTASQNKMSAELQRASAALVGSYDRLKLELREQIDLWKSLGVAERQGAFGQDLLNSIMSTKQQLSNLDSQLKIHVQSLTEVQKAEQKLNFLRSEEGQRLLELKRQINDIISASRSQRATVDEVAQAQERLRAAQAATRQAAYEYNIQAREANRIAKLQAQLNMSATGSYNALSAQYELNKIKLNAMSAAEREGTDAGKQLEAETMALYVKMQKLQEATGNHRLSVGNYARSWDGLGVAVSQVVRELPAAAVTLNTFFLGISNNIPILMDEINKLRAENKKAMAEGKQAKSVIGSIAEALFSWNTLLVLGLTALSMHGKEILSWIAGMFKSHPAIMTTNELIAQTNEELKKTNGSYGQNIALVKQLSSEWQNLSTKKEQIQWIKDNKTEFDKLDISIRNVSNAENVFVKNTWSVIEALKLRAKAAAATKIATEKYEEALLKELEAEQEEYDYVQVNVPTKVNGVVRTTKKLVKVKKKRPSSTSYAKAAMGRISTTGTGVAPSFSQDVEKDAQILQQRHIRQLKEEAKASELEGDAAMELATGLNAEANARLRAANIESAHKYDKNKTRTQKIERYPRGRQPRDITDTIWQNDLSIRKKYELSLSELQHNDFEKRRIEARDQANQTIREMKNKFRKNQEYLENKEGKYKPLTEDQKKQIETQQNEINAIIENTRRKLNINLEKIDNEAELERHKTLRQRMKWRVDTLEKNLEEEKQLLLDHLNEEEALYHPNQGRSETGEEIVVTSPYSEEELAAIRRKRENIESKYDTLIYNMKARSVDNQLALVKKGTEEELQLLLERNEIARKLALAENMSKPVEDRQDPDEINKLYDKKRNQIKGSFGLTVFDQTQKAAEAEFGIVKRSEYEITLFKLKAERDRWQKLVKLAKEGAIDWSAAQIKEAEAMIKKITREINDTSNFMNLMANEGLGGALLTKLGFNDKQIEALSNAVSIVIDNIKAIADAEAEAAEAAVEAAQKRVDAAQSAYDAEIEGRNNGYANNVATAKKELQLEKRNQAQKQKILEEAQRRQQAIDTLTQASSLVTASANLWSAFSKVPIVGPALAIAAIAAMWASFAVAKVRAAQITKASQEYGEGGIEFLSGGSHASGNDIDLHTKNSRGKNMRAEGGEAMAIINKRNTRKYRRVLPQIIDSINKGTFEDKFSQAFRTGDELSQNIIYQQQSANLTQLEEDVRALKRNSEHQFIIMNDGSYIEKRKNVLRRMH